MLDGVYPSDRPTLEGLHEETLRLSRLVEDLNELSLLESGTLALEIEDADLAGDRAHRGRALRGPGGGAGRLHRGGSRR